MAASAQPSFLQRLFPHWELFIQFSRRNVALRFKGSYLGALWTVFNPLLMLALYTFVFGILLGGTFGMRDDEGSLDYALGIFMGLTIHGLLAETMGTCTQVITGNQNLVKKVVFPLLVLPSANVAAAFVNFLVSLMLVFIGVFTFGPGLGWSALAFPLVVIPVTLMTLGAAWAISALGVYFRDVQHLVGVVSLALFYASAIFYPAQRIIEEAPAVWAVLKYNPMIHAIEISRDILLWGLPVNWGALTYLWVFSLVSFFLGYVIFKRLQPGFADVL